MRVFSFAQESTRYCNYSKDKFGSEITCILPPWIDANDPNLNAGHGYCEDDWGNLLTEYYYKVTDKGAWCWFADPRALHYENKDGSINTINLRNDESFDYVITSDCFVTFDIAFANYTLYGAILEDTEYCDQCVVQVNNSDFIIAG